MVIIFQSGFLQVNNPQCLAASSTMGGRGMAANRRVHDNRLIMRSASVQAVMKMNIVQASKRVMQRPNWLRFREGCQDQGNKRKPGSLCRGSGDGMRAQGL